MPRYGLHFVMFLRLEVLEGFEVIVALSYEKNENIYQFAIAQARCCNRHALTDFLGASQRLGALRKGRKR